MTKPHKTCLSECLLARTLRTVMSHCGLPLSRHFLILWDPEALWIPPQPCQIARCWYRNCGDQLRDQGACHALYPNIIKYLHVYQAKISIQTTGCADSSASTKLAAASHQRAGIAHTSSCGRLASEAEWITCRRSLRKCLPEFEPTWNLDASLPC